MEHRHEVVIRHYTLRRARTGTCALEGLIIASDNIDGVIVLSVPPGLRQSYPHEPDGLLPTLERNQARYHREKCACASSPD